MRRSALAEIMYTHSGVRRLYMACGMVVHVCAADVFRFSHMIEFPGSWGAGNCSLSSAAVLLSLALGVCSHQLAASLCVRCIPLLHAI